MNTKYTYYTEVIILFLRICIFIPVFIASFLNITPVSADNNTFDDSYSEGIWNVKNHKLISSWPEENIYMYAVDWKREEEEHRGVYREIVLSVKGEKRYFPCWTVDTNPVWKPTFNLIDISGDSKKELIVISTSGTGTGVLLSDVHVFTQDPDNIYKSFIDIYVMDPLEAIYQNIKAKMIKKNGVVTIILNVKGKDYIMTAKESDLVTWGDEVGFGALRRYKVVENKLIVEMSVVVGNGVSIADIVMDYVFENNRLRVDNVTFRDYDSSWPKWTN